VVERSQSRLRPPDRIKKYLKSAPFTGDGAESVVASTGVGRYGNNAARCETK